MARKKLRKKIYPKPYRIILGGMPHSGKSTFAKLFYDQLCLYGINTNLIDLDYSSPTLRLVCGEDRACKTQWNDKLGRVASKDFATVDGISDIVIGDGVGGIKGKPIGVTPILSRPADGAIIISRKEADYSEWVTFYKRLGIPILGTFKTELNGCQGYFNPKTKKGKLCNLSRELLKEGKLKPSKGVKDFARNLIGRLDIPKKRQSSCTMTKVPRLPFVRYKRRKYGKRRR